MTMCMTMCIFCKHSTIKQSTTTHVVNHQDSRIIIKNVPCLECEQCDEKYYTDDVSERLEQIVNEAEKLTQELSVLDYNEAV